MKARCCAPSLALLLALALSACTIKRQRGDVTVAELFADPWKFNGKRVAVIGFYQFELEQSALCAGNSANDFLGIWVDLGWRQVYLKRIENRNARVVGIFHYRPDERRTLEKRDDGREFESITPLGFGHMGLYKAELSDISSFRPLK